jgi:UDP-GlcNAc:undecaprenyl-phosphate GlcNAc-1-phosphate transferase
VREYLVIFGVAIGVAYLLSSIARQSAQQLGAVAKVRDRDVHAIPTPYFGGPAMLGGLVAAYLTATHLPFLSGGDESLYADVRAVLVGGAVICLVGIIDDLFELDALSKFAGQVLAGVITVAMGLHFVYLPLPNTYLGLDQAQAMILTVFLIVATAILTISLAGACLGILPHNFFPARMFIGDSGSMLLGFVLACSSISLTGQFPATSLSEGIGGGESSLLPAAILPLVLPFAILTVPFLDMGLAVLRRTRAGRSPFSPDKMHIHHRLLEIGHSHRRAVLLMYAGAALVAFGVVAIGLFSGWQLFVAIAILTALVAAAIFLLPKLESRVWS